MGLWLWTPEMPAWTGQGLHLLWVEGLGVISLPWTWLLGMSLPGTETSSSADLSSTQNVAWKSFLVKGAPPNSSNSFFFF